MAHAQLDVYSHGVKFSRYSLRFAHLLGEYMRQHCLQTVKRRDKRSGRMVTEALNTFAAARSDYSEVYLLKSQLPVFFEFAHKRGYSREHMDIIEHPIVPGIKVSFNKIWKFEWKEEQPQWLEYMTNAKGYSLNTAQTGKGKSAMSMEMIYRRGVRTAMILSPKYMKNWHGSLFGFFDFEEGEIIEVRGKDPKKPPHPKIPVYSMEEFQDAVDHGLEFKIVIISINLMQRYISDYEANNCIAPYTYAPSELWQKCGIGLLVHDEAHEWLHFLYKVQCYANVPEIIYLSATVENDDAFIERMYTLMFPMQGRYNGGAWDKYIVSTAVTYALTSTEKVRYKGFGGSYSHILFEQSIMKHERLKKAYYDFIFKVITNGFMNAYQEGMKMLVYCASVEMCQSLAHYLGERLPMLTVGAYTQKEDFETLFDNDVSVTTVKSAGTGIDLPDLVFTFMTLAMGSRQGNIQVLGRLRKLRGKFEGLTPNFYYLVCRDIEAHRKYHQKKVENFSDKVLTQRIIDTDFEL